MSNREYRVVWHGEGSSLPPLQLGRVCDSLVMARMEADLNGSAALKAEGCRVWVQSRHVGPWVTEQEPILVADHEAAQSGQSA